MTKYISNAFKTVCKRMEIIHFKSSPHYHQSNGATKKSVDTWKIMIKNTCEGLAKSVYTPMLNQRIYSANSFRLLVIREIQKRLF